MSVAKILHDIQEIAVNMLYQVLYLMGIVIIYLEGFIGTTTVANPLFGGVETTDTKYHARAV